MVTVSDLSFHSGIVQLDCYGIFLRIDRNVSRLFVTDFTTNNRLVGKHEFECSFDNKTVPTNMIFQLTLFKEHIQQLTGKFRSETGEHLFEPGDSTDHYIKEKFCFLKVKVLVKGYQGILDGRVKEIEILNQDERLHLLYERMFSYIPVTFIRNNWHTIEHRVPAKYLPSIAMPETFNGNWDDINEHQPNGELSDLETIPKQENEGEDFPDGIIPDTQYQQDYTDAQIDLQSQTASLEYSNSSDMPNKAREIQKNIAFDSTPSQSQPVSQLPAQFQSKVTSFADFKMVANDRQSIYSIRGQIVGIIPQQISQVCVKSYQIDSMGELVLSDPHYRPLELIFKDLNSEEQLSIIVEPKQMGKFLQIRHVELAYVRAKNLQPAIDRAIRNKKSYKLKIKLSTNFVASGLPDIWTIVDTTIADFD